MRSLTDCVCVCMLATVYGAHNPLLELNYLLFFFLSALKVNLNQSLKLHQVLLHPFTMDILQTQGSDVKLASTLTCNYTYIYTYIFVSFKQDIDMQYCTFTILVYLKLLLMIMKYYYGNDILRRNLCTILVVGVVYCRIVHYIQ